MTPGERAFDLRLAGLLTLRLVLLIAVLAIAALAIDGRRAFNVYERKNTVNRPFRFWTLRTMDAAAIAGGATGGHKPSRITRTGALLRALRLDELPQLISIAITGTRRDCWPVRPSLPRPMQSIHGGACRPRPGWTSSISTAAPSGWIAT